MRITESQLRRIVREEISESLDQELIDQLKDYDIEMGSETPPERWWAITNVLISMGRRIPRMGDTDSREMEKVLKEIEAALNSDPHAKDWSWWEVAEVAEAENYHAVNFYIDRLRY